MNFRCLDGRPRRACAYRGSTGAKDGHRASGSRRARSGRSSEVVSHVGPIHLRGLGRVLPASAHVVTVMSVSAIRDVPEQGQLCRCASAGGLSLTCRPNESPSDSMQPTTPGQHLLTALLPPDGGTSRDSLGATPSESTAPFALDDHEQAALPGGGCGRSHRACASGHGVPRVREPSYHLDRPPGSPSTSVRLLVGIRTPCRAPERPVGGGRSRHACICARVRLVSSQPDLLTWASRVRGARSRDR